MRVGCLIITPCKLVNSVGQITAERHQSAEAYWMTVDDNDDDVIPSLLMLGICATAGTFHEMYVLNRS